MTDIVRTMAMRCIQLMVLIGLLLQSLLGGLGASSISLCIGSAHEPRAVELAPACSHGGDQGNDCATLIPTNDPTHDDRCPCTDVEIETSTLLVALRKLRLDPAPVEALPLPSEVTIPDVTHADVGHGRSFTRDDDPGGRQRLVIVRATRLLI